MVCGEVIGKMSGNRLDPSRRRRGQRGHFSASRTVLSARKTTTRHDWCPPKAGSMGALFTSMLVLVLPRSDACEILSGERELPFAGVRFHTGCPLSRLSIGYSTILTNSSSGETVGQDLLRLGVVRLPYQPRLHLDSARIQRACHCEGVPEFC
jgi:hypothetical protein